MDLISYAQNQEDIMLWRAVQNVRQGFYIDVGAAHPSDLSVTKLFYDHGWSGINIEPNADYYERLIAERPRDVNLAVVATSAPGERVFHHVIGTGLSTLDNETALQHERKGFKVKTAMVQCRTLADICVDYRPNGSIHFLKIDVEGSEGEVLKGADFRRFRPWIVLVEATRPMSQDLDYVSWEPALLEHDYQFVWFDGLNRFYVASEHVAHLIEHFSVQPNVFDGFVRAADLLDRIRLSENHARERAEAQVSDLANQLKASADYAQDEKHARERAEAQVFDFANQLKATEAYAQDEKHARERAEAHVSSLANQLKASEDYAEHERSLRVRIEERLDAVEIQTRGAAVLAMASIEEAGRRKGEAEHRATIMDRRVTDLEKLLEQALETEASTARKLDLALSNTDAALRRADSADERRRFVELSLTEAQLRLLQSEDRWKVAEDMVRALRESTSWRATRPFRILVYLLHGRIGLREATDFVFRRAAPRLRPPRRNDHEQASIPSQHPVLSEELLPAEVPVTQELDRAFTEVKPDLAPNADHIQLVLRQRLTATATRRQPGNDANMVRR
jgi:FkbM family methyltransferase